ncbi:hypothetical protein HBB16_01410 [Pseudonocardia sp. MCCB 268]|nr:hypothetical protein [Pseudonocardia cytotoxica]
MLGNFVDAEDVVQEAFIRLERALARGEQVDSDAPTSRPGDHAAGDRPSPLRQVRRERYRPVVARARSGRAADRSGRCRGLVGFALHRVPAPAGPVDP